MTKFAAPILPDETVINKIYLVRGVKVMLDRDLAQLYGVETKALKQAVKRNIGRFPEDFMYEMSVQEFANWRSQFVTSKSEKMGLRYRPLCFTEAGVAMLSSVLSSETAIRVNIQIIRVFTRMRELLVSNKEILGQLEKIEGKLTQHDQEIALIFEHLKFLLNNQSSQNPENPPPPPRPKIGFRRSDEPE